MGGDRLQEHRHDRGGQQQGSQQPEAADLAGGAEVCLEHGEENESVDDEGFGEHCFLAFDGVAVCAVNAARREAICHRRTGWCAG